MGLSLEFYCGDARAIGAAVSEIELDGLRDGTLALAYADFSLHLLAEDLDTLSVVAAERLGFERLQLSECLIQEVGSIDDGIGGGADIVDPAWVEMIASLQEADAVEIASYWFRAMSQVHDEQVLVTEPAALAIGALIRLCKKAKAENAEVVHVWYL